MMSCILKNWQIFSRVLFSVSLSYLKGYILTFMLALQYESSFCYFELFQYICNRNVRRWKKGISRTRMAGPHHHPHRLIIVSSSSHHRLISSSSSSGSRSARRRPNIGASEPKVDLRTQFSYMNFIDSWCVSSELESESKKSAKKVCFVLTDIVCVCVCVCVTCVSHVCVQLTCVCDTHVCVFIWGKWRHSTLF
jgi:hypothetical protein